MSNYIKITPRGYTASLNRILDHLFLELDDREWTQRKLAKKAKLCEVTISKLRWRRTKYPEFLTVWKIANALGFNLEVEMIRGKQKGKLRKAS